MKMRSATGFSLSVRALTIVGRQTESFSITGSTETT